MSYSIGELAKKLNLASSTIRYYDKEGLFPHIKRKSSGIRVFSEKDFHMLQIIECLKIADLSIKDLVLCSKK
jgi:DNA-binding transcriptional MerR regulator